jgi:hypothetical protein
MMDSTANLARDHLLVQPSIAAGPLLMLRSPIGQVPPRVIRPCPNIAIQVTAARRVGRSDLSQSLTYAIGSAAISAVSVN